MPLTGELEHLPIVDVIQLIHSTRKSGTLNVFSCKGEGKLVFNSGYISGASHSNEKLKIGQILLEANIVSPDDLDKALNIQQKAGEHRKPLITTLIEHCAMSEDDAFKALETLIEMTVVEMVSWTRGIFSLDVDNITVCDDYKYLPAQLQQITLDTQMVLMDALRIFDEKVHTGEITIVDEPLETESDLGITTSAEENDNGEIVVSEDILGLANLDKVKRRKPRVFKSLEAFDPTEIHRQVVSKTLPDISEEQQIRLVNFLTDTSTPSFADDCSPATLNRSQAIIMYTADEFLRHAVMTVCKKDGVLVFITGRADEIDTLIERAQSKLLEPILVFGSPEDDSPNYGKDVITQIRNEKIKKFPQVSIIQLASPIDCAFSLQSLNDGILAVLPKPYCAERQETFVEDTIDFLNTFQSYVRGCFNEERRQQFAKLRNSLSGLRLLSTAPDISLAVLQFVGEVFDRSLTFILDRSELIAERGIGITQNKALGPMASLKTRIAIPDDSLFKTLIKTPKTFFGPVKDPVLQGHLYPEIGAPQDSHILLLPLKSNGRVITLTYADFGKTKARHVPLDFIEFFVSQAGLTMKNALFRKQLSKKSQ